MGILYKYGSLGADGKTGAIEHFLEAQTARFAAPSAQNDINEAVPNVADILQRAMRQLPETMFPDKMAALRKRQDLSESEILASFYNNAVLGDIARILSVRASWQAAHMKFRRFGIFSLSESNDNLLMWAHYAGGELGAASGLCIGFDSSASVFQDSEYAAVAIRGIQKVNYSTTRATFDASSAEARLAEIVLTKSKDWEYEREFRCIRQLDEDGSPVFPNLEARDVQEVILGAKMPLQSALRCVALHAEKFSHAKLLLALPDPESYKMVLYPCPEPKLLKLALGNPPSDIPPLGL